jgi:hypothetical protein
VPVKQHLDAFDVDARIRVTIETSRGRVSHWAVQLEWHDPQEGWVWIVRYDTAGGSPHRDRNLIAAHEEVMLPTDPGRAIRVAKEILQARVKEYTHDYLAAKAKG